jgi:HD-GYP domain-containing protein (c-di-GMP phosphodiesterase class II)
LSPGDLAIVRRHPEVGATLLRDLPILRRGIPVVLTHHERVDGGGYPHGLSGNAIPIDGRVFQIADAYDAIRNDRPYRKGRSDEDARGEMARHAGLQFDRELLAIFADIPAREWAAAVAHLRPIKESA